MAPDVRFAAPGRPYSWFTMPDARDLTALMRHAVQAGDWRLVSLVAGLLGGQSNASSLAARRAYATLVVRLGLTDESNYHGR